MIKFPYDKAKALEMMLYIISKVRGCDKHTLMKVCFFADMNHLANHGRPVTGNNYIKMSYGPVPSEIYNLIQYPIPQEDFVSVAGYSLTASREPNLGKLSKSDIRSIDYALELLSDLDFKARTEISHGYAWSSSTLNKPISYEVMLEEIGDIELLNHVRENNAA